MSGDPYCPSHGQLPCNCNVSRKWYDAWTMENDERIYQLDELDLYRDALILSLFVLPGLETLFSLHDPTDFWSVVRSAARASRQRPVWEGAGIDLIDDEEP
jgi:hypothetical protein